MKLDEMRGKAREDLAKAGADAREELFKKRYAMSIESVENSQQIRELRKRIARIETVLSEKARAAASQAAPAPAAAGAK